MLLLGFGAIKFFEIMLFFCQLPIKYIYRWFLALSPH